MPPDSKRYPLVYPPPPAPEEVAAAERRKKLKRWKPKGPFPFLRLPAELRAKVLENLLLYDHTIDLEPQNYRKIAKRLDLFRTSRQIHAEAYPIFYGRNTFRLFPIHKDFLKTDEILLTRLPPHYRAAIQTLELRLGPEWADPPRCWTLGFGLHRTGPRAKKDKSGLEDCAALRDVRVFVEIDPSHPVFEGFRIDESFYTTFCSELLRRALLLAPAVARVDFDAWSSVHLQGPLMRECVAAAREAGVRITYGPLRGWREESLGLPNPNNPPESQSTADVAALAASLATIRLQA